MKNDIFSALILLCGWISIGILCSVYKLSDNSFECRHGTIQLGLFCRIPVLTLLKQSFIYIYFLFFFSVKRYYPQFNGTFRQHVMCVRVCEIAFSAYVYV